MNKDRIKTVGMNNLTDDYIKKIAENAVGRMWVDYGSVSFTSNELTIMIKTYIDNPRLMLETFRPNDWDKISNIINLIGLNNQFAVDYLINLAFDNATDEELKMFSLHAKFEKVRNEAAKRYAEKYPHMKYLPNRLDNGYHKDACWVLIS